MATPETVTRKNLTFTQLWRWLADQERCTKVGVCRNGGFKVAISFESHRFDTVVEAAEEIAKMLGVPPPWESTMPEAARKLAEANERIADLERQLGCQIMAAALDAAKGEQKGGAK